jgi:hypothetical protein
MSNILKKPVKLALVQLASGSSIPPLPQNEADNSS